MTNNLMDKYNTIMLPDTFDSIVVSLPSKDCPSREQIVVGKQSAFATDVEEFRGIPYGKIDRRWTHSTVRSHLPCDVFDATRNGPRCPQPSAPNTTGPFQSHLEFPSDVEESEFDCLNLLIARPAPSALRTAGRGRVQELLPVYVYIHGGAFAFGAATDPPWDPARLVSRSVKAGKPIIVVNINYRLNIFGFLASSELLDSEGCNFGFFDQVTALKWIIANISAFNGDCQMITLGGQSAGGVSVYNHALRSLRMETGVQFRSCIIQSPAIGLVGPFDMQDADERWKTLSRYLQVSDLSPESRLANMRSLSAEDLLNVTAALRWEAFTLIGDEPDRMWPILPIQHSPKRTTDFLSEAPITQTVWNAGPLQIMTGITSHEASFFFDLFRCIQSVEEILSLSRPIPNQERILHLYNIRPEMTIVDLHESLYRLLTDVIFTIPANQGLKMLEKSNTKRPARVSQYFVETGNPFAGPFYQKANHCIDLVYLYDCFHDDLRRADCLEARNAASNGCEELRRCTNAEMVDYMQLRVIDFIDSDPAEGWSGDLYELVETVVYDQNRRPNIQVPGQDAYLQDVRVRVENLQAVWYSARAFVQAILTMIYK